ncbi:MAG: porin family protein [Gemmatimonadales bacterium]
MNGPTRLLLAALLAAGLTSPLPAQNRWGRTEYDSERPRSALSLIGGISNIDEGADGNALTGGIRFDVPVGRFMIVEPGVTFLSYRSPAGGRIEYLLPEVSFQAQLPVGPIRPYAGIGAGFTEYLSGRGFTYGTLHAAGGVRVLMGDWGLRGEVRVRAIDPFRQTTVDLTAGVMRRFGGRRD